MIIKLFEDRLLFKEKENILHLFVNDNGYMVWTNTPRSRSKVILL